MANRQLIETLTQLSETAECCVCSGDTTEFVQLPCSHSICSPCFLKWNKTCVRCRQPVLSSSIPPRFRIDAGSFTQACSTLIELLRPVTAPPSPPALGWAIERHLMDRGDAIDIAVVGAQGAGKTALVAAITGATAVNGRATGRWFAYSTHSQSKVRWWDCQGLPSWSRRNTDQLLARIGQVESTHGFQFKLVVVVLRAWHKVRADRLQRFLRQLRLRGTAFMLVTSDVSSLGSSELRDRKEEVRALLQPHSSCRAYNAYVDKFVAPDVFALYVNSTAHAESPFGPAIEQEGITELIICALMSSLPSHDKEWLMGTKESSLTTLLRSVMLSEPVVSGGVILLVSLLAVKSSKQNDSEQLDPLTLLAVD